MLYFCASKEEEAQVREFQQRVADIDHWKNSPQTLMYFLRDCHHKLNQAEKRFRNMIQWRLDNNVDHMLETYRPPKLILKHMSCTILRPDCCDFDGDIIYTERPGNADSVSLYQRLGKQAMVDYVTWIREEAARGAYSEAYQRHHGRRLMKATVVVDLHGLGARHMKPGLLPVLRSVMEVGQLHYCGVAKRIFVIR